MRVNQALALAAYELVGFAGEIVSGHAILGVGLMILEVHGRAVNAGVVDHCFHLAPAVDARKVYRFSLAVLYPSWEAGCKGGAKHRSSGAGVDKK